MRARISGHGHSGRDVSMFVSNGDAAHGSWRTFQGIAEKRTAFPDRGARKRSRISPSRKQSSRRPKDFGIFARRVALRARRTNRVLRNAEVSSVSAFNSGLVAASGNPADFVNFERGISAEMSSGVLAERHIRNSYALGKLHLYQGGGWAAGLREEVIAEISQLPARNGRASVSETHFCFPIILKTHIPIAGKLERYPISRYRVLLFVGSLRTDFIDGGNESNFYFE